MTANSFDKCIGGYTWCWFDAHHVCSGRGWSDTCGFCFHRLDIFIGLQIGQAVLVEIHPSYRQDRHFRHAARLTGKIYMPIRSLKRETCEGTSDNVVVPLEEFKTTIDGALRIARCANHFLNCSWTSTLIHCHTFSRNFDDGLSECGLLCPPSVLALDERLDPHYQTSKGEFKGVSVNTQFPC